MTTKAEQKTARLQREADRFNNRHSIGTEVRYWTGLREGDGKVAKTRHQAVVMGDHVSVWVEGEPSCIALSHVEPIQKVRVTMDSERLVVVGVTAEDAKGFRRVKIKRTRERGNTATVVFKEIRFAVGDFTTWPSGWAHELRGPARGQALRMIESHPGGYQRPNQHPLDELLGT